MNLAKLKPMLAKDANLAKLKFPVIVQPKYDGIRCLIVNGKPVSRTFKPIPNLEIQAALSDPRLEGLDGELIVGKATAHDCMQATTSFVMAANKTGAEWRFYAFDKWDHPGPYVARAPAVEAVVLKHALCGTRLATVPDVLAQDVAELENAEAHAVNGGWEGVIVRVPDSLYKFGRSGATGPLLKIKRFSDSEAEIVGVYEEQHNGNEATRDAFGRTERSSRKAGKTGKGTLGGFEVRDRYSGVEFRVGTGFTAQDRAEMWADADALIGRTIKYKFFPVGVKDKPRFPTFLGFREGVDLPSR